MAVYGTPPFTDDDVPELMMVKSNIGGYFFDAVLKVDHTSRLKITSHPVEMGADISDHAYVEPAELTFEVGMSDACAGFVAGQFADKYTRSVSAFAALKEMQDLRLPVSVLTRLKLYHNMLIESLTVPDDYMTLHGLKCTVSMREIIVARTKTVVFHNRASAAPQKTGTTNKGTVQPKSNAGTAKESAGGNKSILKSGAELGRKLLTGV